MGDGRDATESEHSGVLGERCWVGWGWSGGGERDFGRGGVDVGCDGTGCGVCEK